jgi:hypothetical protein
MPSILARGQQIRTKKKGRIEKSINVEYLKKMQRFSIGILHFDILAFNFIFTQT